MPRRFLVTAALPYSNNRLHVGHVAGAYLPSDVYVRYLRACGHEVLYVCGSDDNGVAIEISAAQQGRTPQEISTHYHERQREDFARLRIDFDIYGGTHQPAYYERHCRFSADFFRTIYDRGHFTKRVTRQFYDPQAGRFLPDRYVRGVCPVCRDHETYGDQCDRTGHVLDPLALGQPRSVLSGAAPEVRETAHWHLRLGEFEEPLRQWLESKQGLWRPQVLNFALGQIRQGLPERAMTRDLSWGISVPLDDPDATGKVLYVWFDAPIGYVSFTAQLMADRHGDEGLYREWWCDPNVPIVHFIGEDNTIFHALTWPAMLMADGRHQLPHAVVANAFLNYRGDKISKSTTPEHMPVWIEQAVQRFDPDVLRYYLTAIAPETARRSFEPDEFVSANNSALLGTVGNLVNRILAFKPLAGRVPSAAAQTEADRALLALAKQTLDEAGGLIEGWRFTAALESVLAFAQACNVHVNDRAPWKARKENPADADASLATSIHAIRFLSVMLAPFLPTMSERIVRMLGLPPDPPAWRAPDPLPAGHALGQPEILVRPLEPGCMEAGPTSGDAS